MATVEGQGRRTGRGRLWERGRGGPPGQSGERLSRWPVRSARGEGAGRRHQKELRGTRGPGRVLAAAAVRSFVQAAFTWGRRSAVCGGRAVGGTWENGPADRRPGGAAAETKRVRTAARKSRRLRGERLRGRGRSAPRMSQKEQVGLGGAGRPQQGPATRSSPARRLGVQGERGAACACRPGLRSHRRDRDRGQDPEGGAGAAGSGEGRDGAGGTD